MRYMQYQNISAHVLVLCRRALLSFVSGVKLTTEIDI